MAADCDGKWRSSQESALQPVVIVKSLVDYLTLQAELILGSFPRLLYLLLLLLILL